MKDSRNRKKLEFELADPKGERRVPRLDLPIVSPPRKDKSLMRATVKAARSVGNSASEQLGWLLDFAHLDFGRLSEQEQASIRRELLVFLLFDALEAVPFRVFRDYVQETIDHETHSLASASERMVSEAEAQIAHAWVAKGIAAIEAGKIFSLDFSKKLDVRLKRSDSDAERLRFTMLDHSPETISERFAARVHDTLRSGRDSVRRCADCRSLYVPTHGLQDYCSKRCSQRVRTEKWRKAHPEKARSLRRNQYQEEIKRKQGAKVAKHIRKRTNS
jgi:hypothetical protein